MVDKGIVDMNDLVEVWRSPLIPNGPLVVRTALGDDMQAEVHRLLHRAAEDRRGLLRGDRGRRLHRLRPVKPDFYKAIIDARKARSAANQQPIEGAPRPQSRPRLSRHVPG